MSEDSASKSQYALVEVAYGKDALTLQPIISRITNANEDLTTPLGLFYNAPELKVEPITYTGTLQDSAVLVSFGKGTWTFALVDALTSPFSTPIFYAKIWEYDAEALTYNLLASGEISRVTENKDGVEGMIQVTILNEKIKLDKLAGAVALDQCDNSFGDGRCLKIMPEGSGIVDAIDDFVITLSSVTPVYLYPNKQWDKGYIDYNGNRITIRRWDPNFPATFSMREPAPLIWIGKTVVLGSGCDQAQDTCTIVHDNETQFNGIGIGVVDYNPQFENPDQDVVPSS